MRALFISLIPALLLMGCDGGGKASVIGPTVSGISVTCSQDQSGGTGSVGDTTVSTTVNCPHDSGNVTNPPPEPVVQP